MMPCYVPVCVIPAGVSLNAIADLLPKLQPCFPHHVLMMSNDANGNVQIGYDPDTHVDVPPPPVTSTITVPGDDGEHEVSLEFDPDDLNAHVMMLADLMHNLFEAAAGTNYVTWTMHTPEEKWALTLQLVAEGTHSPAERIHALQWLLAEARDIAEALDIGDHHEFGEGPYVANLPWSEAESAA